MMQATPRTIFYLPRSVTAKARRVRRRSIGDALAISFTRPGNRVCLCPRWLIGATAPGLHADPAPNKLAGWLPNFAPIQQSTENCLVGACSSAARAADGANIVEKLTAAAARCIAKWCSFMAIPFATGSCVEDLEGSAQVWFT
jgi:hypothetical protein